MKFHWVTLRITDMEQSLAFYTELLELPVAARFGDDQHQIAMLGQEDAPKIELLWEPHQELSPLGRGVSVGLSFEDIEGRISALKAKGIEVRGPVSPNPQLRFYFISDPDGYTLQLVEPID